MFARVQFNDRTVRGTDVPPPTKGILYPWVRRTTEGTRFREIRKPAFGVGLNSLTDQYHDDLPEDVH